MGKPAIFITTQEIGIMRADYPSWESYVPDISLEVAGVDLQIETGPVAYSLVAPLVLEIFGLDLVVNPGDVAVFSSVILIPGTGISVSTGPVYFSVAPPVMGAVPVSWKLFIDGIEVKTDYLNVQLAAARKSFIRARIVPDPVQITPDSIVELYHCGPAGIEKIVTAQQLQTEEYISPRSHDFWIRGYFDAATLDNQLLEIRPLSMDYNENYASCRVVPMLAYLPHFAFTINDAIYRVTTINLVATADNQRIEYQQNIYAERAA